MTSASCSASRRARQRLGVGDHLGDPASVLARQPRKRAEPLLDELQPPGLGLEPVQVRAQLGGDVLGLIAQRREPLGERRQLRIERAAADSSSEAARRQQRAGAVPVLGDQRVGAGRRRRAAAPPGGAAGRARRAARPPPRRSDRSPRSHAARSRSGRARARARRRARRARRSAPRAAARARAQPTISAAPPSLLAAAEGVQRVELRRRQHQLAMLVLSVEGEHAAAELAQVARPSPTRPQT